jgi:hypothetical protein
VSRTFRRKQGYLNRSHISGWTKDICIEHKDSHGITSWGAYKQVQLYDRSYWKKYWKFHTRDYHNLIGDLMRDSGELRVLYRKELAEWFKNPEYEVLDYDLTNHHDWD